jgi:hypothetical protein
MENPCEREEKDLVDGNEIGFLALAWRHVDLGMAKP